jgi:protocatechuate 3,4-dioxygenase beta subunit
MSRSQPTQPSMHRRALLKGLAGSAALVVVSQGFVACAAEAATGTDAPDTTGTGGTTTTPSAASCVLTAALTEGPYFVDEKLERSDIRSDPATGAVSAGAPLSLTFNVSRVSSDACTPLTGAYLDVWHCDAAGTYSDVSGPGNGSAAGRKFLRGYQITDANGVARFTTIYPGWYSGRAVHVHFKLRLFAGITRTYEFTSQFFFDEALTSQVHAQSPYNSKGTRNVVNGRDGIYNSLSAAERATLTLQATADGSGGYAGVINLGVQVG